MTHRTDRPTAQSTGARLVDTPAELTSIDRGDVHLIVWRRSEPPNWLEELQTAVRDETPFDACSQIEADHPDFSELSAHLPTPEVRDAFKEDARKLMARFVDASGATQVEARLELTDQQNCPKFHVDYNSLRLICTYIGPGTEWIPANEVSTFEQHKGRHLHGQADEADVIRRVQTGDVVLLEGKGRFDNESQAPLHRSPWLDSDQQRLVFKLTASR